jgi:hypothetical protein
MIQQVTQGCGACPHCGKNDAAYLEGWDEFWVCRDCRKVHNTKVMKCTGCTQTNIEHRTWHVGPICGCLACDRTYGSTTGLFSVPSASETKQLEQYLIARALRRS